MSELASPPIPHAAPVPASASEPPSPVEPTPLWKALRVPARFLTTVFFDLKTYHEKYVPRTGGVLLVANHQSYLDPIMAAVHLQRPVSFFAKSELFENPYFSRFIRSLHAFPVKQGKADTSAIKEAIRRLKEGHILNIYPEGTRTPDGEIKPIEKGIGLIVRQAGVPVVPVAIDGTFNAYPSFRKYPVPYPVRVLYGPPMALTGLKGDQIVQLIEKTLRAMLEELRAKRRVEQELARGRVWYAKRRV